MSNCQDAVWVYVLNCIFVWVTFWVRHSSHWKWKGFSLRIQLFCRQSVLKWCFGYQLRSRNYNFHEILNLYFWFFKLLGIKLCILDEVVVVPMCSTDNWSCIRNMEKLRCVKEFVNNFEQPLICFNPIEMSFRIQWYLVVINRLEKAFGVKLWELHRFKI